MRRISPKGSGRSCCSSATLEENTAWPELLCVVMTCGIPIVMGIVLPVREIGVLRQYVGDLVILSNIS